jgi:hypothetical protein
VSVSLYIMFAPFVLPLFSRFHHQPFGAT